MRTSEGKVNSDVLFTCNMGALKGAVRQSGLTYLLSEKMNIGIDSFPILKVSQESKIDRYKSVQVDMDFIGSNAPTAQELGLRDSSYPIFFNQHKLLNKWFKLLYFPMIKSHKSVLQIGWF